MSIDDGTREFDHGARRLQGAMLEHPNLAIERMPGLSYALNRFIAEAPARLASLIARPSGAAIEEVRATTLFQAIGECSGLTAAIYESVEPEARFMIALDERIDSLIVSSIFGEAVGADQSRQTGKRSPKAAHGDRGRASRSVRARIGGGARGGLRFRRPGRAELRAADDDQGSITRLGGGMARRRRRGLRSA